MQPEIKTQKGKEGGNATRFMPGPRRRVILVTDGDMVAKAAVERATQAIGGRCISLSAGNPTPLDGRQLVDLILRTPHDPVVVMFDDKGTSRKGKGERALEVVARDPRVEVLGAVAVASHTEGVQGVPVDFSITRAGEQIAGPVDKEGRPRRGERLCGDTVDVLNRLEVPVIVGLGDLGKMAYADEVEAGASITTRALREILAQAEQAPD